MKKCHYLSYALIVFGILLMQFTFISPVNLQTITNGVFDIKNQTQAQSKTSFSTREGEDGFSTYQTKRVSPTTLEVFYDFERQELPNPLSVNYKFEIRKLTNGDYEMDMTGAMPFLSMYIAPTIETIYEGANLTYPNIPTVGEELPDANGEFRFQFIENKYQLLSYEVAINNRQISRKDTLSINGRNYEAYVHTYDFSQKTILHNETILTTINEEVTEWLVPQHGLVKRDRKGNHTTQVTDSPKRVENYQEQSNLLTIQKGSNE